MRATNSVEWRPVVGFEDAYEVSSDGQVRSVDRVVAQLSRSGAGATQLAKGRLLSPVTINGYRKIKLWSGGKSVMRGVHRLMAEAFIGPCPGGMEVCHGDGNRMNNVLGNLRYGTRLDNALDRVRHGRSRPGSECHLSKLTECDVTNIRSMSASKNKSELADEYGVSASNIRSILVRETWNHI